MTDDELEREEPTGPPSSVLGGRLAGDTGGAPAPSWSDLGLDDAKRVAFAWQQQRSRARWNEFVVVTRDARASEWVTELHGLIGVVGELLLVSIEAEVEKEILTSKLSATPGTTNGGLATRAAANRSLRFFAEGQGNELTITGHALANLTLRTLALHPQFQITPIAGRLSVGASHFAPGSTHRKAWTSLTADTADAMAAAAGGLASTELGDLAQALHAIAVDPAVDALKQLRNDQYHRWRGESPGVTGVNFGQASMRSRLEQGEAVGFGHELLPGYQEGQTVLDDLVSVSREALDAFVTHLDTFLSKWHAAFDAATS